MWGLKGEGEAGGLNMALRGDMEGPTSQHQLERGRECAEQPTADADKAKSKGAQRQVLTRRDNEPHAQLKWFEKTILFRHFYRWFLRAM